MQRAPSSDQELNLKKRARRRLVGAIALVLLMVIVLPMILKDRSATQPQDQITITLPSEQVQAEASDFDSSIVPMESPVTVTPEVAEPESAATTPEPEAATSKAETLPAPKPASKPSPNPSQNTSIEPTHKFYVQIGVFSDAANVKQLQAKLSDLGYKSQTEKIDTEKGKKIRLRTQVFGDRNEAAIALENIKDAGLTGMVVSQ
jgi:DedD protein